MERTLAAVIAQSSRSLQFTASFFIRMFDLCPSQLVNLR
eukprot:COSAG01_NODE_8118_length_2915_cov_1.375355_5_plen_39_part_00